jgi:uncharacterized protein YjeT (DUF2065 family)
MIRWIVGLFGLLVVLAGLSEIIFPNWARAAAESMMSMVWLRLVGVIGVAIGVVFIVAAAKSLVGLRLLVLIVGIYVVVASLVMFASPAFISDLMDALFLKRSEAAQCTVLWASGLVRIVIGCALIYAFARPPRPTPTEQ